MKITREIKTAILVLSSIVLLIFLFNYLKGQNLLTSSRTYYALYDNVEGLASSTPVTINGLKVGKVQSISFTEDGTGKLLVALQVDNEFEFSKNSKAELYDASLIGGKAIAIVPAFDKAENAKDGSYLESSSKDGLSDMVTKTLSPLQAKVETMMVSADALLNNINDVFDADTKEGLKKGIAALDETILTFKGTANSLNAIVKKNESSLTNTLANAENLTGNLSKITDSIAMVDIGKTMRDLQNTMHKFDAVIAGIENGEGSVGKLLKDDGLYNNLEGASKQMEELLEDMKLNPKRYVHFSLFGKKAKQYDAEGNEIKSKD
ncbi:MlaD family protein [Lacinutrix undariae]